MDGVMDLVSIALVIATFAVLLGAIAFLDRI